MYYYICSNITQITMNNLSKAEEQLIKHLWKLERAYMKDLVESLPDPKPAYTTVATLLSRMVDKGYVGFIQRGKVREYFPKIEKGKYFRNQIDQLIHNFFNDSTAQFASFFASGKNLSVEQLKELREIIDKEINKKKS